MIQFVVGPPVVSLGFLEEGEGLASHLIQVAVVVVAHVFLDLVTDFFVDVDAAVAGRDRLLDTDLPAVEVLHRDRQTEVDQRGHAVFGDITSQSGSDDYDGDGLNTEDEDVNNDGVVDIDDIFDVLAHWGEASGPCDVNQDGIVDIDDVFEILAQWGPC